MSTATESHVRTGAFVDRTVPFRPGTASIPERLLLSHARGEVLFVTGAGISMPSKLPNFRSLTLSVYERLDPAAHAVMQAIPLDSCTMCYIDTSGLTHEQAAEVKRVVAGDFDVALGMLERRLDGRTRGASQVRQTVGAELRRNSPSPAPIHRALMRLADRGGSVTILTTNFDLLLEDAARRLRSPVESYALGGIPRPGRVAEFSGVLHIHGMLQRDLTRSSDLVLTDQDFGEFYLRRRVVPDLIYDAARLFNLVLVGYSANDAPMRYLLNAVAADGSRFDDLKERFAFVGSSIPDEIGLEDWRGRGITPIPYDSASQHSALHDTLAAWAKLSPINGKKGAVDAVVKRIVRTSRAASSDADRDLFDHLYRRADLNERVRLSSLVSSRKADIGWLDAIADISAESRRDASR